MQATILFLHLMTGGPTTSTAVLTTAEFSSAAACERAGREAQARLGTSATKAQWFCTPKGGDGSQ